jgi:hypothetical protein
MSSATAWYRRSKRNYSIVWKRDEGLCQYCFDDAEHVEHLIPVAAGGTNVTGNMVLACARCNLTASDDVFDSFDAKREYILRRRRLLAPDEDYWNIGFPSERILSSREIREEFRRGMLEPENADWVDPLTGWWNDQDDEDAERIRREDDSRSHEAPSCPDCKLTRYWDPALHGSTLQI